MSIRLTKVRAGSPKSFSLKAYYALMVLGAFLVVSTTAATSAAGHQGSAAASLVEAGSKSNKEKTVVVARLETAGLLTGVALTTGGAMWGAERLAEALKRGTGEELTGIDIQYSIMFSAMICIGLALIVFSISQKHKAGMGYSAIFAGVAGTAGALFGVGIHLISSQINEEGGIMFLGDHGEAITCFGVSGALLLALAAVLLYMTHGAANPGQKMEAVKKAALHGAGFVALVGGSIWFSYSFAENMQDRFDGGEADNMGLYDSLGVWGLWTLGFLWLIKTFLVNKDNIFSYIVAGATATAISGFLVGGFELITSTADVSPEGIFLLTCGGALIVALITLKVLVRTGCLKGQGAISQWLSKNL